MAQTRVTQSATSAELPKPTPSEFDITEAIRRGTVLISASELLGCDYIFIQHPAKTLLMHERQIVNTLNQLLAHFSLSPKQKVFVSLHTDPHGDLRFYRFECEWDGALAKRVTRQVVTDNDQGAFMQMIYDCSSPLEPESA